MDNRHGRPIGLIGSIVLLQFTLWGAALAADSPLTLRFNGGFDDVAHAVVSDRLGNFYVGGAVESTDHKSEFAVLKYDANGVLQWTAKYLNSTHGTDAGTVNSVAVDAAGNVYAAGYVYTNVTLFTLNMDWLVVSYTPNGVERWSQRINGTANVWDNAGLVVVDAAGNVYVNGSIDDTENGGQAGWTLIKYSPTGNVLWRRTNVRTDGIRDALGNMRFDAAGNLVGSANVFTQSFPQHKIVTTKVDPNGNILWRTLFSDTAVSDDFFADMEIDAGGNIYVTGETVPSTNPELVHVPITLKYNGNGTLQYVLRGDGAGGSSLGVADFGDVVVSGTSLREGGNVGLAATAKYDSAGNRKWLTPGVAGEINVDSRGNIYAVSSVQTFSDTRIDLQTVKLSADGTLVWQHRYDGGFVATNGSDDRLAGSTVDLFDNLLVVDNTDIVSQEDIVTLRYAANVTPQQPPVSINAPSNLLGNAQSAGVLLSWSDNSTNEAAFGVERCLGKACTNFAAIGQVGANTVTFNDASASKRTTYRYRVRATNQSVASPYSNVVTVTTPKH